MNWKLIAFGIAAYASLGAGATAQVAERTTLTLDGAKNVLAACEAEAKNNNATGVIAVVDDGGNLIAVHRIDGTFSAGANISIGKARTAAMFRKPTKAFEDIIKNGRTAMVALSDFTPLQGGVPIVVDGQVVGAVGVSGAASAQQDEEIAIAGANSLGGSTTASSSAPPTTGEVAYFDRQRVAAAFQKSEPLFTGNSAVSCAVNPSRRDGPGQAEVHRDEADVIYIQDGAATLITGGAVVDPKETASGEIRGTAIDGGETRTLAKRRRDHRPARRAALVQRGRGDAALLEPIPQLDFSRICSILVVHETHG
jgi:glc operon protein GlcG